MSASPEMNLLALLTRHLKPIQWLMDDLGIRVRSQFWALFKKLQELGFDVRMDFTEAGQRAVYVHHRGWKKAFDAAMEYANLQEVA